MRYYTPSHHDTTRRVPAPAPAEWGDGGWGEPRSDQDGSFDKAATPRMGGALPGKQDAGSRGVDCDPGRSCRSTSRAQNARVDSDSGSVHGGCVGEEPVIGSRTTAPHSRIVAREDAEGGTKDSVAPEDLDGTWEECGLAKSKATRTMHRVRPDGYERNRPGAWDDPYSVDEKPEKRSDWDAYARAHKLDATGRVIQRPVPANNDWHATYGPAQNTFVSQHQYDTGVPNPFAQSTLVNPPDRRLNSRINPDNYDGNRAGLDGSRVFYSAILPTVPTLRDIGNHAEYTAWFDMLRSILKYHQLTTVITRDANRPHGYREGRRWDQDRLRAAIIIKGALSFEVFERVKRNGWKDTEDPAETVEKIRETHGAVCPCGHSQGMTLLDL
ncbi:hypothetical protein VUR80DRAFT_3228 [Thermomyces stellatus]